MMVKMHQQNSEINNTPVREAEYQIHEHKREIDRLNNGSEEDYGEQHGVSPQLHDLDELDKLILASSKKRKESDG